MPVSISSRSSPRATSRQLVPMRIRLRSSAGFSFSHSTRGTTPNMAPPSRRNSPSLTTVRVRSPSFMAGSISIRGVLVVLAVLLVRAGRRLHHRLILLRRHLRHLEQEGHDRPDLRVGVGDSERRHAGHLDAVLHDPEELFGIGVLRSGGQLGRIGVQALADLRSLDAGRAVAGRAVFPIVQEAAADHRRIGQRRHLDVFHPPRHRALAHRLHNPADGADVRAAGRDVEQPRIDEAERQRHQDDGEEQERPERFHVRDHATLRYRVARAGDQGTLFADNGRGMETAEQSGTAAKPVAPAGEGLAIVLTGGGARAAYQSGVLRGMAKHLPEMRFPIISGISAGAINAAYLAAHAGTTAEAAVGLSHVWEKLRVEDVFHVDPPSLSKDLLRWTRWATRLATGNGLIGPELRGLLDTEPLRRTVCRAASTVDGELLGIERNLALGKLRAICITALNYMTGQSVTWIQGDSFAPSDLPLRRSHHTRLTIEHIMASSSLPLLFPAVRLGSSWYGDGGVRLLAPLSPALRLGATRILAISPVYIPSHEEAD